MRHLGLAVLCLLATAAMITACGGDGGGGSGASNPAAPKVGDPGPIHVHGLGINPKDGALFIATHTGLFRAAKGERKAKRIADRFQDTMGFTVVGADRFLGSGHPDGRERLPAFLGLIESRDAGRTWEPVSLLGKRDFHVLEASGERIYGFGFDFETRRAGLLVSDDGGRSWQERSPPEDLISLAIDPADPDRVIASGGNRLYRSSDAGRHWHPIRGRPGLLSWPRAGRVFIVAGDGAVSRSGDAGRSWREIGEAGGEPAAFEAEGADDLYVAFHDGTIKRSTDGGASWAVRSTP